MAYSRKVHNGAASVLKGYFSEKEIDGVNAKMDAGSKKYGPHHHSLDLKHAAFAGMGKKGEDLPVRLVHAAVDAGATIALAGEKVTGIKRPKIFTQRN